MQKTLLQQSQETVHKIEIEVREHIILDKSHDTQSYKATLIIRLSENISSKATSLFH
jgi:hypothetical protein